MIYTWINYERNDVRHYIDFLTLPESERQVYAGGFVEFVEDYRVNETAMRERLLRNMFIATIFVVAVGVLQFLGVLPLWVPGWWCAIILVDGDTRSVPFLGEPVRRFLSEMGVATPCAKNCLSYENCIFCAAVIFICGFFNDCALELNLAFSAAVFVLYPMLCIDMLKYTGRCRSAIELAADRLCTKAGGFEKVYY